MKSDEQIINDIENIGELLSSRDIDPNLLQKGSKLRFMGRFYRGILVEIKKDEEMNSEDIRSIQNLLRLGGYHPTLDEYDGNLRILGILKESEEEV